LLNNLEAELKSLSMNERSFQI